MREYQLWESAARSVVCKADSKNPKTSFFDRLAGYTGGVISEVRGRYFQSEPGEFLDVRGKFEGDLPWAQDYLAEDFLRPAITL